MTGRWSGSGSRHRRIARSTAGSRALTSRGRRRDRSRLVLTLELGDRRRVESAASGEQLVHHQPQREDVAASRDLAAEQLFRCHVGRRAGSHVLDVSDRRQAEVHDPHSPRVVEHDVGRLQIAMDDAALVRGGEPCAQLPGDLDGLVVGEAADSPQRGREILSVDILHRQIEEATGLADVIDAADVGMGDLSGGADLVVELREARRIATKVVGQELQRDRLSEAQIVCPIDLAHPAASEKADDPITLVENGARSESAVADGIGGCQPAAR